LCFALGLAINTCLQTLQRAVGGSPSTLLANCNDGSASGMSSKGLLGGCVLRGRYSSLDYLRHRVSEIGLSYHAATPAREGGERSWIWAAVSLSRTDFMRGNGTVPPTNLSTSEGQLENASRCTRSEAPWQRSHSKQHPSLRERAVARRWEDRILRQRLH